VRRFSFRPAITIRGRKFKGLRGWAGKPLHPPLTDVPIGGYILAAAFDVISVIGNRKPWARDFYRAATFVLIASLLVALLAILTGLWDWLRSTERGTQARRTANAHASIMTVATVVVLVDIGLRWLRWDDVGHSPAAIVVLSLAAALLTAFGATYGGSMVFDYGFNVETAGDHPVWHRSEVDVFPGHHPAPADAAPDTDGAASSAAPPTPAPAPEATRA
jgi:uncharacterized membrane protein